MTRPIVDLTAFHELRAAEHTARGNLALRLGAVTTHVGRVVLDFHRRDGEWCAGCESTSGERESWPCYTVLLVADASGVAVPAPFAADLADARKVAAL